MRREQRVLTQSWQHTLPPPPPHFFAVFGARIRCIRTPPVQCSVPHVPRPSRRHDGSRQARPARHLLDLLQYVDARRQVAPARGSLLHSFLSTKSCSATREPGSHPILCTWTPTGSGSMSSSWKDEPCTDMSSRPRGTCSSVTLSALSDATA